MPDASRVLFVIRKFFVASVHPSSNDFCGGPHGSAYPPESKKVPTSTWIQLLDWLHMAEEERLGAAMLYGFMIRV